MDIMYKTNVVSFRFNVTEVKSFLLMILTCLVINKALAIE